MTDPWDSISCIQAEISGWADAVFPERTPHNALCKLMLEEIPEFALSQDDPEEYADLVILVLDIATLRGIDVGAAVRAKMEKNRSRVWAVDENGIMKHVKVEDHGE